MHLSCTICAELYQESEEVVATKCGHLFHGNCVKEWLEIHQNCPHCRNKCCTDDLLRVYFTEISDENVHLDKSCESHELKIVLASEREIIKSIELKLKQADHDLLNMGKHIDYYTDELKVLTKLNDKLKAEHLCACNELEFLKNFEENPNGILNDEKYCDNFNDDIKNEIIELQTIIESYRDAEENSCKENQHLQKQLNMALNLNEKLEKELKELKDNVSDLKVITPNDSNNLKLSNASLIKMKSNMAGLGIIVNSPQINKKLLTPSEEKINLLNRSRNKNVSEEKINLANHSRNKFGCDAFETNGILKNSSLAQHIEKIKKNSNHFVSELNFKFESMNSLKEGQLSLPNGNPRNCRARKKSRGRSSHSIPIFLPSPPPLPLRNESMFPKLLPHRSTMPKPPAPPSKSALSALSALVIQSNKIQSLQRPPPPPPLPPPLIPTKALTSSTSSAPSTLSTPSTTPSI